MRWLAGTYARLPVIRTPRMLRHREDHNPIRFRAVDKRKGKATYKNSTSAGAVRRARRGERKCTSRRFFHCGGEPRTQSSFGFTVIDHLGKELEAGGGYEPRAA